MAVIRFLEGPFEAQIYIEQDGRVNICTPSYRGLLVLHEAVKVLHLLVKLQELPPDVHERLYLEVETLLSSRNRTSKLPRS